MGFSLDACVQSCTASAIGPEYSTACLSSCFSLAGWRPPPSPDAVAWCAASAAAAVALSCLVACIMASTLGLDNSTVQGALHSSDEGLRRKARRVENLRSHSNLLLCSLLVFSTSLHMLAAATLIEVMGPVVGAVVAGVLLLLFSEMLPPGICNNRALSVAAGTAWLSWGCILLLFPISWPLSGLLSCMVADTDHMESFRSCFGFDDLPTFQPKIVVETPRSAQGRELQHLPSSHSPKNSNSCISQEQRSLIFGNNRSHSPEIEAQPL